MAKAIEINVEELIARIEDNKEITLDNYYGYIFRPLKKNELDMFPNPEDYIVVNPIYLMYGGVVYKLPNMFNNKEIGKLPIIPEYPNENGEYDGGVFYVNRNTLYEFLRNSQQ